MKKPELYTFIMEYLGGTYISQVNASNEFEAMRFGIEKLEVKSIKHFTVQDKKAIIKTALKDEDPISIKDLKNVWCFLIETKKGFGHINFVKTK